MLSCLTMPVRQVVADPGLSADIGDHPAVSLSFAANQGQWNERAVFMTKSGGTTVWLTATGICHQFLRHAPSPDPDRSLGRIEQLTIRTVFANANPLPAVAGEQALAHRSNYFKGADQTGWHTDVPSYGRVVYRDIYDGVDLEYYGRGGLLEYDFIVSPGADHTQIQIVYEGVESLDLNTSGELVIATAWGEVTERIPMVYQNRLDGHHQIAARFELISENSFGFTLEGVHDPALELVIDPVLTYSTYLGGEGPDMAADIVVDRNGNAYVVGHCFSDFFPTQDPYQLDQGGYDAFVAKINVAGDGLVYSTYLGGSDDDWGEAIAIDSSGNAYLTGHTSSGDFPTLNPFQPGLIGEGDAAFVVKLNSAGNDLIYSTYLGGDDEDHGQGIAVDETGCAIVTGYTASEDFPTQSPYQTHQGGRDAFVTRLNATGTGLVYSTYLGGSADEEGCDLEIGNGSEAYVVGSTASTDFPTQGPYQAAFQGGGTGDVFITRLGSAGDALIYSTYLGGGGDDQGRAVALDFTGNAYVSGYTESLDFPVLGSLQSLNGTRDAFVTRFTPIGDAPVYSTYLGGDGSDEGLAIAVDCSGSAWVTGSTTSTDFPTVDAFQAAFSGGGYDAFALKLSSAGDGLDFATYLGGNGVDIGHGVDTDPAGNAYLAGATTSSDLPTQDPLQEALDGIGDAFIVKYEPDNHTPIARCRDILVPADTDCLVAGSIDDGSYDPDGDPLTVSQLPAGPYPAGVNEVVLTATDDGGLWCKCRASVTVMDTVGPVVVSGPGPSTVECVDDIPDPDPALITADDNCDSAPMVAHIRDDSDGSTCPETITRLYSVSDEQGNSIYYNQVFTVLDETPPSLDLPATQTHFVCGGEEICVPLSVADQCDPNPILSVVSGPGTIADDLWCYIPESSEAGEVTVRATDQCGNYKDVTFQIDLTANTVPYITNCPQEQVFMEFGAAYVHDFVADDPDLGQEVTLNLCPFPPDGVSLDPYAGHLEMTVCSPTVCLIVTDECGATDDCSFEVCMVNRPPVITEIDDYLICQGAPFQTQISVTDPDIGPVADFSIESGPPGVEIDPISGVLTWAEPEPGVWEICVQASERAADCDLCNEVTVDVQCFQVDVVQMALVIGNVTKANLGEFVEVGIEFFHPSGNWPVSGFDLLIEYERRRVHFLGATIGTFYQDCEWEYFSYRFGGAQDCGGVACATGVVRLVAIADSQSGLETEEPDCFTNDGVADPGPGSSTSTQLVNMNFAVSTDRIHECRRAPIRFLWYDCDDNGILGVTANEMLISDRVYEYGGVMGTPPVALWQDVTGEDMFFPTVTGAMWPSCREVEGTNIISCAEYYHGGVDIACGDETISIGDINQNYIPYEIADVVMFTNYFLMGLEAFGEHVSEAVENSDANRDGHTLTISDLVYMIRVVVGDIEAAAKLTSAESRVKYWVDEGVVTVQDDFVLAATSLTIRGEVTPTLLVDGFDLAYNTEEGLTRIVITPSLGSTDIDGFGGSFLGGITHKIVRIELAAYDGSTVIAESVPTDYRLSQNHPNPFNPVTTIGFSLPTRSRMLIRVYNVLGHHVVTLVDDIRSPGDHQVTWDGTDVSGKRVASGIYLYRLEAAGRIETRKMVLLK